MAATIGSAAESKSSLIGATRAQLLAELGEPRSSIVAGTREVLLFERERVVLRNHVVVEVDLLPGEPVRRAEASETTTSENAGEGAAQSDEGVSDGQVVSDGGIRTAAAPPKADAPLEIRAVRPAGSSSGRSTTPPTRPPDTPSGASSTAAPVSNPATPALPASTGPVAAAAKSADATATTTGPAEGTGGASTGDQPVAEENARGGEIADTGATSSGTTRNAEGVRTETSDGASRNEPRGRQMVVPTEEGPFTTSTYFIAAVIVAGGIGYLVWRARQRRLELAATAVSRTPFSTATPTGAPGARFTPDMLAKMEWKRFEDLVAAYYGKTGVVAARTKTGPGSAVHIKISWKGESRPFAYVQCIPHPSALVDATAIQELVAALMADDIRRGYVVTSGKFSVAARDFAEEKHITLLPGELLLEKLNALPDGARNELMQEITRGDFATPSCPKCEAKMTRTPDDPQTWRCPTHPDVTLPAWK